MSPRCPRFQSVIPTRTRTGLTVSLLCGNLEDGANAAAGTAADAIVPCLTNSRRVIDIADLPARLRQGYGGSAVALREGGSRESLTLGLENPVPAFAVLGPLDE